MQKRRKITNLVLILAAVALGFFAQSRFRTGLVRDVVILYVAAIAIWGNGITWLIYTARYQGYFAVLVVLAAAIGIDAVNVPLRALIRVMNHPETEFYGSALALVIVLATCAGLVPVYGILGAAVAILVGRLVIVLVNRIGVGYWSGPDRLTQEPA